MKTDAYRLQRISETGHQLLSLVEEMGITGESLSSDHRLQWLVSTPLYNIGEHANCLSAQFVDSHPEQPWASIAGLRHRLVHDYEGTNWNMIGSVLENDLRPLIEAVDEILSDTQESANNSA